MDRPNAHPAPTHRPRRPPPTDDRPQGPPDPLAFRGELRTLVQPLRLLGRTPWLLRAPRGDGGVVLDIPGWRAPEASMAPLRTFLRRLGHDARPWGFGTNVGHPERDADRLLPVVRRAADTSGRPVALVGWSLGGVVAREVARRAPALVSAVVTYGTPVIGGPAHTLGARSWGKAEVDRIEALQADLDRTDPILVPVTAIFTRNDHVVNWLACLDHASPDVHHVEARSTHLGLGLDPDVWLAVAEALAEDGADPQD